MDLNAAEFMTMRTPGPAMPPDALRPGRAPAGLLERQRSFTEVLSKATGEGERAGPEDRARQAARDFVAMAFVQPVLKQLRESNHTAAPFAPGPGERQFRALMDAEIARKVVGSSDWPLVDRLARQLLERQRGADSAKEGKDR